MLTSLKIQICFFAPHNLYVITTASEAPFLLIHSVILLINLLIILNAKHEELDIKIVKSLFLMYLESNRRGNQNQPTNM